MESQFGTIVRETQAEAEAAASADFAGWSVCSSRRMVCGLWVVTVVSPTLAAPAAPVVPKKRKKRRSRSAMDIAADACGLIKVRSASGKVYYE